MASDADTIAQLTLALQEEKQKHRGLSWFEALSVWDNLFSNPTIQYRHTTMQPSAFTAANDRRHPVQIDHWTDFHQDHETAFTHLCNQLGQPEVAAFESNEYYEANSRMFMPKLVLKDEVDLVAYEERTVEEMVVSAWEKKGGEIIEFKRREDHTLDDVTLRLEQMKKGTSLRRKRLQRLTSQSASTIKFATLK